MEYLCCHVTYPFLLTSFYLFMIFGPLCTCLRRISSFGNVALAGEWSRIPLQWLSGRRLRTTVLETVSFTFGRGSRQLSPPFSTTFFIPNYDKIKYYLLGGGDISHGGLFQRILLSRICRVPQVIWGTPIYAGYL